MKVARVINIIVMLLNVLLILGGILKTISHQMDLNNPIISESLSNQMLFQDIFKTVFVFCVFLFQLKLYKGKRYVTSILLLLISIFIYNIRYFYL